MEALLKDALTFFESTQTSLSTPTVQYNQNIPTDDLQEIQSESTMNLISLQNMHLIQNKQKSSYCYNSNEKKKSNTTLTCYTCKVHLYLECFQKYHQMRFGTKLVTFRVPVYQEISHSVANK